MVVEFKNEPGYDFSVQENVDMFKKALKDVEKELGQDIPLVINGEKIFKDDKIKSINPADTSQVIANASKATKQDVEDAFKAANEAYKSWKTWSANDRAELMLRVSAIIRRRKAEIAAIMVYEAGKPWDEAVGDAAEGIDFIEYYARSMMDLAQGKPVLDREGEHNKYFYKSIGTGVTIPPWNFPFAIMAGTTLAPVVAGNTVLLKPAEDTPYIAYKLMEILEEAGLPKGVVNFVPGDPKEIGDYLVDHKDTHFVTFTGSRATGTRIYERSAVVQEGQNFLKRVIAEMGGKDAIVVDENIDTDYGLTGAVITNNREHWIKAVNEFDVGNLYLNRGCTSAVVGYHPFGGFKMSGTDAKTGSPDYLLHFLEQKVVSEMF